MQKRDLFIREVNLWHSSGSMQRLKTEYPEVKVLDRVVRAAAMRILKRDLAGVVRLAWRTYASAWSPRPDFA